MNKIIEIRNLSVRFKDTLLYKGLNAEIYKNEKVAIVGESGSGKSTLINVLLGFIPEFEGKIKIDNKELNPEHIDEIRKKTALVPQELSFGVFPTVKKLFYRPFEFKANRHLYPTDKQVKDIFKEFELDIKLLNHSIKEISGGQKQRIVLAAGVLLKKPILFLDEPTSALNKEIKNKITDYIFGLKDVTVVASTHDEYFIKKAQKIIQL
jgi:ABC-type multidrug transport system ATPase subunit